jgi:formylglycine-generating enzyme required for sulfatase activity
MKKISTMNEGGYFQTAADAMVFILGLLLLIFPLSAVAGKASGFDIVTMTNGDILQGTVAVESLSINTGFGKISIPYHRLHTVKKGAGKLPDLLTTRQGERFCGQIVESDMTMLRVLHATLTLATGDIAAISFASRGIRTSRRQTPDVIKSRFGDQFVARVLTRNLLFKTPTSLEIIDTGKIRFIDSMIPDEEDAPSTQITLVDGAIHQGQLIVDHFEVETSDGVTLKMPVETLSGIRFGVSTENGRADFSHRWEQPPPSLFQDAMVDGLLAPEMVIIQGREFVRGDAQGDSDERPPTAVTPGMFAIGVFEVTFDEYDQFCAATNCNMPDDEGWGRGNNPVFNVSWQDAKAYTEWLSNKTHKRYRLPSDAEWEYAARAGTETKYWWGDEAGVARANCEGCNSLWDGAQIAPVGKFAANSLGLHDTAGNVFEWVADCYHDSFANAPANGAPLEKPGCGKRVIRGGAWSFTPKEIRSANRWRDFPSRRSDDTGFRVAMDM